MLVCQSHISYNTDQWVRVCLPVTLNLPVSVSLPPGDTPICLLLASLRMSIMRVANSRALNLANFCRPWLRTADSWGLTGRKGTERSFTQVLRFTEKEKRRLNWVTNRGSCFRSSSLINVQVHTFDLVYLWIFTISIQLYVNYYTLTGAGEPDFVEFSTIDFVVNVHGQFFEQFIG